MIILPKVKNILSLTAKQVWPYNTGFIHLFFSVYKTLSIKVFDNYQYGVWFSWLTLILGTLTALLLLCIFNLLIAFVSLRQCQVNLQMVIQEYYLVSTQDPVTGSANKVCLFWHWRFNEKIRLVGSTSWHPMGLSFWTISKHLLFDRRTRPSGFSMMYCNISEIIPGPTFGQRKHKIIDSCKHDFNIFFPVHHL